MKFPTIVVRGKESTTAFMVAVAFVILMLKFAFEGLSVSLIQGTEWKVVFEVPVMGAAAFAAAFAAIVGLWQAREYREKTTGSSQE